MAGKETCSAGVKLKENQKVNAVVLKESLRKGQHCAAFKLTLFDNKNEMIKEIQGTTIGNKRILTFPAVDINTIEITILDQDGATAVSEIEGYYIEDDLTDK